MASNTNLQRNLWIDYLRSAITILVIAHHSSLAYTTFANFDKAAYINSTNPVVDNKRWIGLDIFANFNDIFFMFLMFLIGGLYLFRSLAKKGVAAFIKDRFYRLLIPFLLGGTFCMLIAYIPAYYIAHEHFRYTDYLKDFFGIEAWPVGPPWFIWVLFVFNFVYAISTILLRNPYQTLSLKIAALQDRPVLFTMLLLCLSWLLYVPAAYQIGAGTWTGLGPFDFQVSRILAYFGFFMLGVLIGYRDFNNGLFKQNAALVRGWKIWIVLSILMYSAITLNGNFHWLQELVERQKIASFSGWMIYYTAYVICCVCTSLAFITSFRVVVIQRNNWWNMLSTNAYLMYLIHYVFITWTQFLLLGSNLPAFLKFLIVFSLSLGLSLGCSILLRRIHWVRKWL